MKRGSLEWRQAMDDCVAAHQRINADRVKAGLPAAVTGVDYLPTLVALAKADKEAAWFEAHLLERLDPVGCKDMPGRLAAAMAELKKESA